MIKRYSRKELTEIWSEENKYKIWLDVEIAAAQAMEKLGQIPKGVSAKVNVNTNIVLESADKQLLGQVCAEIRKYRPPEPYKGKGILFKDERLKRKAGKAGKV